jgi:hypothetical protein
MTIATGKLTDAGLSVLRDKLVKLNKRAARLGLEPLTVTVLSTERVTRKTPSGLDTTVCINEVECAGSVPRVNGWEVVARIEFTGAGNLVHCAPGAEGLDCRYRNSDNVCDHCNTNRVRNDLIVLRHSDGREIRVGRNCCADYVRTGDAAGLIEYAGWLGGIERMVGECDEDGYREGNGRPVESVETIVRAASICIRKLGWTSGREAYEDLSGRKSATKNDVCNLLWAPPAGSRAYADWKRWIEESELTVCDYDRELAAKALEWARTVEPGKSDYLANLKVLAQLELVGTDKIGYLVSVIPAYNRACDRETERAARADAAAAKGRKGYIGEPKKRMRGITATCTGLHSFEGHYGVTTLVRFEHRISDSEYAVLAWFATGDKTEDFEKGTEYTFDATCKDHNDHEKYGKQTRINRVTVKK